MCFILYMKPSPCFHEAYTNRFSFCQLMKSYCSGCNIEPEENHAFLCPRRKNITFVIPPCGQCMPSNLMPESMTFTTQDEAAPRFDNVQAVHRAEMPDSFPPLDRGRDWAPHPQQQAYQQAHEPIPVRRPRYSAEQLLSLQGDYRGILRSAETMQSAPPVAQEEPAVRALLQRSQHLQEVMRLIQEQVRTNTEQIQALSRREQVRLEQRRAQHRRAARRAVRLDYITSSRRASVSSQATQQHNPLPHLNQQTTFRHDSTIGRESRRSVELFTPEQLARIARRQSYSIFRRSASPERFPGLHRRRSPDLIRAGRLSSEQEAYRARRSLDRHHPLSASWPRDRYRQQPISRSSTLSPWARRFQPRPAARQGFRSPDPRHSDSSSDHAQDDIEQMRHSWPQMPARATHPQDHNPCYGVPLASSPEPAMFRVADRVEVARAALRNQPPPPPSPVHATLYPALEEAPPSPVRATLYEEHGVSSQEDAPPPSPRRGELFPDSDSDEGTLSPLSDVSVPWRDMRWDSAIEDGSSWSSGRSPFGGSWEELAEGEIRE